MVRGRKHAVAAAVCATAAAALLGCGDSSDFREDAGPAPRPLGKQLGGSVAPLAECGDWKGGARDRKFATIADIRSQVNRTDTGITSPPLSDAEAMALFDNACAPAYAASFRLYVLYARAAGYAPLRRGP